MYENICDFDSISNAVIDGFEEEAILANNTVYFDLGCGNYDDQIEAEDDAARMWAEGHEIEWPDVKSEHGTVICKITVTGKNKHRLTMIWGEKTGYTMYGYEEGKTFTNEAEALDYINNF